MTGWRLGYSVWPEKVAPHAEKIMCQYSFLRKFLGAICRHSRINGDQSPVKAMVSAFDERRAVIVNELNKIPGF